MTDISKSKDNKAVKYDQVLEYNMRNIFPEKSYTKCGGDTFRGPFSKKLKLRISLGSVALLFIWFVLIVCQVEDNQNILKLSCRPFAFTSY